MKYLIALNKCIDLLTAEMIEFFLYISFDFRIFWTCPGCLWLENLAQPNNVIEECLVEMEIQKLVVRLVVRVLRPTQNAIILH